jgi:signal transduction histidine kinase
MKLTDEGGVTVSATVRQRRSAQPDVVFAVADTGIGIADEDRESWFESFRQVDGSTTRRHGGTGLGLSICKRLAELMGGGIWFESVVGEGSTFYLTVPAGRGPGKAPAAGRSARGESSQRGRGPHP